MGELVTLPLVINYNRKITHQLGYWHRASDGVLVSLSAYR